MIENLVLAFPLNCILKKKISVYKILYSVETCTTLKKLNEGNAYYEEYSL